MSTSSTVSPRSWKKLKSIYDIMTVTFFNVRECPKIFKWALITKNYPFSGARICRAFICDLVIDGQIILNLVTMIFIAIARFILVFLLLHQIAPQDNRIWLAWPYNRWVDRFSRYQHSDIEFDKDHSLQGGKPGLEVTLWGEVFLRSYIT